MYPFGMSNFDISIIVPVFNEVKNLAKCIEQISDYRSRSALKIEVIIIESGSTDGTHELIHELNLTTLEDFSIYFEEKPNGKGSACILGIKKSSGKVICIFDADNEYKLKDLTELANPILSGNSKFVLGSRHSNGPMRTFKQSRIRAIYFNFGHNLFTKYFNILYSTKLKDPATMWKVFDGQIARDLIFTGLKFDFDWEILAYFVRLGHIPKEYTVNYTSRSPNEGKKIRPFADPLHWIIKITFFRFNRIQKNSSSII